MPAIPPDRFPPKLAVPSASGSGSVPASQETLRRTELFRGELVRMRDEEMERSVIAPSVVDDQRVKWLNRKIKQAETVTRTGRHSRDTIKTLQKLQQLQQSAPVVPPVPVANGHAECLSNEHDGRLPNGHDGRLSNGHGAGGRLPNRTTLVKRGETVGTSSRGVMRVEVAAEGPRLKDSTNTLRTAATHAAAPRARVMNASLISSTPKSERTRAQRPTVSPIRDSSFETSTHEEASLSRDPASTGGMKPSTSFAKEEPNLSLMNLSSASQVVYVEERPDIDHDVSLDSVGDIIGEEDPVDEPAVGAPVEMAAVSLSSQLASAVADREQEMAGVRDVADTEPTVADAKILASAERDVADTVQHVAVGQDVKDTAPLPPKTPEPTVASGPEPSLTPLRVILESATRSPGGTMFTKRFTATISSVDGQPEDVLTLWNEWLRFYRPAGVLDIREERFPFNSGNAQPVMTEESTTKPAEAENLAVENVAGDAPGGDVDMEAVIAQDAAPVETKQLVQVDILEASSSVQGCVVAGGDDRVPSTSPMDVDEPPVVRSEPRDEFHKYLDALMNKNSTVDELEQLELDFDALCAHDVATERVMAEEEVVESDEELSSGEDEAFDMSGITKMVEEVMSGVVAGQEAVVTEAAQQGEQPKKRDKGKSLGIDLADILAQAASIELNYSDSEDSFELDEARNLQETRDVISDEDDDSTDMEIEPGVGDFIDGVLKGLREAEEERRAQQKTQRKEAKAAAGASDSDTTESEASDEESVSDRSEPEQPATVSTVPPSNTQLPKKAYDISDDELLANIAELLGKDPAAEDKSDGVSEGSGGRRSRSTDRHRSSSGKKSGGKASNKPSKGGLEDDDSEVEFVVRKSPSKPASQSRKLRRLLESDSEYEPSEHDAAEKHVAPIGGKDDDVVVLSSGDESVAEMPDFNRKLLVNKAKVVEKMDKKKRKPVRVKKILADKDLSRESKQALKREQERTVRLEKLPVFENGILDKFTEGEEEYEVEVYPILWNKLEEHQKGGVKFMYRNVIESYEYSRTQPFGGCILAHSMGLGKTVQVISFLQAILSNKVLNLETCLVLCPASTVGNWESEVNQWMNGIPKDLTIQPYTLTDHKTARDRLRLMERWKRDGGVLIMSYAMYTNLCKAEQFPPYLQDPGPDIVVCDEAHELKNSQSARTIAVSEIGTSARIALTGTPMQNNLDEYYTMVNFIKPSLLGTRKEFGNRFAVPIKDGSRQGASREEKKMMQKRSYVLRDNLATCLELKGVQILMERLPPKTEHVLRLRLTPAQEALYLAFTRQLQIQHGHARAQMLSCTKSIQLISFNPRCVQKDQLNERLKAQKNYTKKHPKKQRNDEEEESDPESDVEGAEGAQPFKAYFEGLLPDTDQLDIALGAKTAILREIIVQCLTNDEKLLIFSDRRVVLSVVEELLVAIGQEKLLSNSGVPIDMHRGINYLALDGSVPQAKRPALIDKFNKSRQCYVFLLSIKAAGQGINLIGASRVVLLEPMWNPTVDRQALFRTYRYGQTKPVHVYRLVTAGICEEKVFEVQVDKQSMFNRVLEEKHAKGSVDVDQQFFSYVKHPYTAPFVPAAPPSDRIVRGILEKFPQAIVRTENFDSLLEPVEQPLTFEEQLVAWAEIEIEERNKSDPLKLPFDRERALAEMNRDKIAPFALTVDDVASTKNFVIALTRKLWQQTKEKRKQTMNGGNMYIKFCRPILEKAIRIADKYRRQEQFEYTNHPASSPNSDHMPSTSRGPMPHAGYPPRPPAPGSSAVRPGRIDEVIAKLPGQALIDIARQHFHAGMPLPRPPPPTVYRNIHPADPLHSARPLGILPNSRPPGIPPGARPFGYSEIARLLDPREGVRPPGPPHRLPPAPMPRPPP